LLGQAVCKCLAASQNGISTSEAGASIPRQNGGCRSISIPISTVSLCALLYANAIKISTMQTFTSVATNVVAPPAFCPHLLHRDIIIIAIIIVGASAAAAAAGAPSSHSPGHTSATIWRFALESACLAIIV